MCIRDSFMENGAEKMSQPSSTTSLVVGLSTPILIALLVMLIIIIILLFWYHWRKSTKQKQNSEHQDGSYSTHNRGSNQAQIASASANLYEQIQLSPSSDQTEIIPTAKDENTSRNSILQPDIHHIYSSVDMEQSQPTPHQPTQQVIVPKQYEEDNILEGPTYAVVEKSRKRKKEQMNEDDSGNESPPVPPYNPLNHSIAKQEANATARTDPKQQVQEALEEMYAIVNKKPKMGEEETAPPPIPPHPVEELYTVVKKNPTTEAVDDKIGTAISMKDNEAYGMASMPV